MVPLKIKIKGYRLGGELYSSFLCHEASVTSIGQCSHMHSGWVCLALLLALLELPICALPFPDLGGQYPAIHQLLRASWALHPRRPAETCGEAAGRPLQCHPAQGAGFRRALGQRQVLHRGPAAHEDVPDVPQDGLDSGLETGKKEDKMRGYLALEDMPAYSLMNTVSSMT